VVLATYVEAVLLMLGKALLGNFECRSVTKNELGIKGKLDESIANLF